MCCPWVNPKNYNVKSFNLKMREGGSSRECGRTKREFPRLRWDGGSEGEGDGGVTGSREVLGTLSRVSLMNENR